MLKVTTLIENTGGEHLALKHEHGICFYVEKDGHALLFDTGQSAGFLANAAQLRIDLSDIEHVVLSHGHYDHTGGLRALTDTCRSFQLTMGGGFFDGKYALRNGCYDYLGNNFDEQYLAQREIAYRFVEQPVTELLPDVFVVTAFRRSHVDEGINPRFVLLKDGHFKPDRFGDEVLIAVGTPRGLVVLLGCSHPGMKNMLDSVRTQLGRPLYAVLGGTHLVEAKDPSLQTSVEFLQRSELKIIGVSHCTGQEGMKRLSCDERYFHNCTGSSVFVE